MRLTEQDIDRLASLAKLALTPAERRRFAEQLSGILDYVERLQAVDTTGIDPEGAVGPLTQARRDGTAPLADSQSLLSDAPATEGAAVKTPRILDEA